MNPSAALTHPSRMTRASLVLAIMLGLSVSAPRDASAATFASVAQPAVLRQGDSLMGALAMTQPIHIEVALKLRDRQGLDAFIASNANAQLQGLAPQLMSDDQFFAAHAPTQAQAQAVANYLTSMGYTNVSIAPNRLLVSANGTVATARNAFTTTLAQVRTRDGRVAFANTSDVRVPPALQGSVLAVLGLQTLHQAHLFSRRFDPGNPHTNVVSGHNPTTFPSIYGVGNVATAAGVTVGIVTEGNVAQTRTDLNTFTANNHLSTVVTQTVNTNGSSADISGVHEWDIDSQDIVGMAGGQIGKIIFYSVPDLVDSDLTADFNTIVAANAAKIINVSLGGCETDAQADGAAAAQDQIFATAVAHGQTFSVATGDLGADECGNGGIRPSWPAASQYVIAVAGTTLSASVSSWISESVWSGSGGSPSTFEPKPSWQNALVSGTHRGVADVAFDADPNSGALVIVDGVLQQWGGTSLSAPIFAGMWARVIAAKGTNVGFAGPAIYSLPATADFHDITVGSNGGETAKVGYDFASGRGSVVLGSAIANIGPPKNTPPVAHFSFVATGLAVNFTDSSTDPDGNATIASHAWTFGDGGTSTATNPSHTYAVPGTYNVSETVTDNGGLTNTRTTLVTVVSTIQLFGNTGFESGKAAPWVMPAGVLNNSAAEPAHRGTWDVWLNGKGVANASTLSQQVAIPAGKASATLSFYLHIDTAETTTTQVKDHLIVRVTDAADNVLAVLPTYSNLDHASGYVFHTFDMTPYLGKTIKVKFTGNENGSLQTSFVLDDIGLLVR